MYQYHTIAGGFVLVNDSKTDAALLAAREQLGDDVWTNGYSERACITTRSHLKKAEIPVVTKLSGALKSITCKETTDSKGNKYRKVRVELQEEGKEQSTILTMEPRDEFAHWLLVKLESVGVGEIITLAGFPKLVERGGRTFANHNAYIKDADGNEIKATKNHFELVNEKVQAKLKALAAADITDREVINKARASTKSDYFWALAQSIQTEQATA